MPAPSRRPGYVRPSRGGKSGVARTAFLSQLSVPDSGTGDRDLTDAARVVADTARGIAVWSRKIPPSIYTTVDGNTATIHAAAPDARPAEFRLMHPLFGDRERWYGPPGRPFLAPALDLSIDEALRVYARSIDRQAKKLGWG